MLSYPPGQGDPSIGGKLDISELLPDHGDRDDVAVADRVPDFTRPSNPAEAMRVPSGLKAISMMRHRDL